MQYTGGEVVKILPALIISLIMLHSTQATAADDVVGKIVLKKGLTEKSNLNCQGSECDNMIIRRGDRIRTGRDSKVQVMLTDGTGIIIYERSDIIFNYVINPGRKKPTDIYTGYGKFKFIQNNSYLETSLVVRTANSLVKSVNATFCLVAAGRESAIFVYSGEAGFASIESSIADAFVIKEGEESYISTGSKPSVPCRVASTLHGSWLSRRFLSRDKNRILLSKIDNGPVDWPFIEKD